MYLLKGIMAHNYFGVCKYRYILKPVLILMGIPLTTSGIALEPSLSLKTCLLYIVLEMLQQYYR